MIVNLDSDSGGACLKKAAAAGIKSIDYDRLTLGGGASYYVSFDNVEVGELMGEGLSKCLDDAGKTKANIVYINGDPTDNNAALFKQGYDEALKPKIDSGDYKLVGDQTGEWDATKAGTAFEQLYTKNDGKIDGVVSANDTMAGGIIARLKANGLAGKVPVTGQDASVEGLQRILAGTQCMTVYKNTNLEAKTGLGAGDRADQRATRTAADALATGTVQDTEPGEDVPSALATPEAITKDNVKKVIDDGFREGRPTSAPAPYAKLVHRSRHQLSRPDHRGCRSCRAGTHAAHSARPAVPQLDRGGTSHDRHQRPKHPPAAHRRHRCSACGASRRASVPCTCCAASTSTSTPARSPRWSATTAPARAP